MSLSKILFYGLATLLFQACYFGDNPTFYSRDLPGDLHLSAMDEKKNLTLWKRIPGHTGSFIGVIEPCIYEIGWTEDFVIAKTYPDLSARVSKGNPSSYLTSSEIVALIDSSYYIYELVHVKNGTNKINSKKAYHKDGKLWNQLHRISFDSISPFKGMTYWHIVDIKKEKKHYQMTSKQEFLAKRTELKIPDTLSFFLTFEELR